VSHRYQPVIGTLVYVWDRRADAVLLVHRVARADDEHLGKWNGLGGKLESHEDVVAGAVREVAEEAGIVVDRIVLRGTVNWPGFSADGTDWIGFVFLVDAWQGVAVSENEEGVLSWIPRSRLLDACSDDEAVRGRAALAMWDGDRLFLPMVFDEDARAFHGVMPYSDGRPTSWSFTRC
jgi:8-oxo-dGTP diphosphatase